MKLSRRRSQILRRLCVAVVTTFAAAGLVPLAGSGAAAATWSVPKFVQSMGGIGRAGIYAWGMDYNPVTREIVVSDYQNFRVRRYTQSGSWIADLPDQKGEAWDVASDPITGEVFVADHRQKKVHRYAKDGSFIGSWSTSSQVYAAWLDVDRNGDVWIVDSADWSTAGAVYVNKYSKEGTRLATWPVTVPFEKSPTVFGIGVSSAGEVFLPDGNNRRIHVFTTSGSYVRSFGSEGSGVGGLSGDLRGMALDEANEVLYVSDTGSNQIEKFAFGGSPLAHWGGMANTADRLQAPRDLTVDAEGDVWVADYGNHRFREFAPDGSQIGVYPQPSDAESNGHFGQARDVHVDSATGDVWVVDTANQHFTRLGSDGAFKGIWGRRGFGDYGLNYPSTIAFEPTYGRVWVANEEGRNIKVYDATGTYQFMIGQQAKTPENRGIMVNPTDIDFRGQRAYVTDEGNTLMQVFDVSTGAKLLEFPIRTHRVGIYSHHGTGIDPVSGDLYVVNHREDRVEVFTADGARKFMFGARGLGDGQFQMPRDAAVVNGVVYVTDSQLGRVQAFDLAGNFLGKWGGKGTGAYQFQEPMGIVADSAGRLYVSDMKLNRVTVFDTTTARPPYESVKPTLSLSTPVDGQQLPGQPVHVTGSASDNVSVAAVEVAVQNPRSGWWFNGTIASWQPEQAWNIAPLVSGKPATSVTFDYAFASVVKGESYRVVARSRDAAVGLGNVSPNVVTGFSVAP